MSDASPLRVVAYSARYLGSDVSADLEDIRRQASRNNVRDGIRGLLMFDAGRFVQVVEGPPALVEDLLGRIRRDPRAGEFEVLLDEPAAHPTLEAWSLWVGRTDTAEGLDPATLRQFREACSRSFRLDAAGFIHLLLALFRHGGTLPREGSR